MPAPTIDAPEDAEGRSLGWAAAHRGAIAWWSFGAALFLLLSLVGV